MPNNPKITRDLAAGRHPRADGPVLRRDLPAPQDLPHAYERADHPLADGATFPCTVCGRPFASDFHRESRFPAPEAR